jgi:hypothetical protein
MVLVWLVLHRLSCSHEKVQNAQNISFGSNGLDLVRSLRKILTQLRLENLFVNGASSAYFASTFVQFRNSPKCAKTLVLGPMEWIGCLGYEKLQRNFV